MTIHVVQPGQTVYSIAASYGVDPGRLAADNEVPESGALAVGQTLVVRFARQLHEVREGETLTSIAAAYGVTVRQLYRNNWTLGGSPAIRPGQVLVTAYFEDRLGAALFNGYAYPFIEQPLLRSQLPYLSYLTPFTYGITAEGSLYPLRDEALVQAARELGVRPVLHLSTFTEEDRFDSERAALVLRDQAVQDALIGEVVQMVNRRAFAGVDVDFEFLPRALAEGYAAFLARLRTALAPYGRFVWAALAPKTSADQPGLLYEAHDYAKLSAASDAVLLMTYEWGYTLPL